MGSTNHEKKKTLFILSLFFISSHFSIFYVSFPLPYFFTKKVAISIDVFKKRMNKNVAEDFLPHFENNIFCRKCPHIESSLQDALLRKCWESYMFEGTKWQPFFITEKNVSLTSTKKIPQV